MTLESLPAAAQTLTDQQGWNDSTLVNLLAEFIISIGKADDLTAFLQAQADAENDDGSDNDKNHEA